MPRLRHLAGAAAILTVALGAPLVLTTSASAAATTSVTFVGETTASAAFGADWSFAVDTTQLVPGGWEGESVRVAALGPTSGTISVTVSGVGGTFASGIPIQPDGRAYISQPQAQALLPSGDYELTAIFVPAGGTDLATSQTGTPATLTITPLALTASAEILSDPTVSDQPFIEARLAGEYLDALGGTPPGTWSFTVSDAGKEVFTIDAPQKKGASGPVRVEIQPDLRSGRTFTLTSVFTPVDEVAGGVTLAEPADTQFSTPGAGFLDALLSRVPMPIWLMFTIGGLLLTLVITVVVLGIRLSRRSPSESTAESESTAAVSTADTSRSGTSMPFSTSDDELALSDEIGMAWNETEGTRRLSGAQDSDSTKRVGSWTLSADAPTEAISSAELDDLVARHRPDA